MSVPAPYTQRSSPGDERCRVVTNKTEKKEDCRDYLRTGRCKYGASCKYNHPLNVQSGGGMKAPIDPSEPLFPIRYNEPVCQYYMKHGTCKFGQACKFHHPPHMAETSNVMNGSNAVLVSVSGGGHREDGGIHSSSMWKGGNDSGVQMLPQRPEEPNCIYFLKNGRCKYGATCRYHHPLKYHHDNNNNINNNRRNGFEDVRNNSNHAIRQNQDHRNAAKVHYVTALPPGSMQQGHFVVADGRVTFLSVDVNSPTHVVSISHPVSNGTKDYATAGTVASSTSSTSIASSFETSITNVETNEIPPGSFWNNRKPSGNISSGYALPRVVSTGNVQSENSSSFFYENNAGPPTWRGHRSSSFDHSRTRSSSHSNREEMIRSASVHSALDEKTSGRPRSSSMANPMIRGGNQSHGNIRNANTRKDQPLRGEVDDGLSMMTSALLNLLDAPAEEGSALQQSEKHNTDDRIFGSTSVDNQFFATPSTLNNAPSATSEESSREHHNADSSLYLGQPRFYGGENTSADEQTSDRSTLLPATLQRNLNGFGGQPEDRSTLNQMSRIQSWQGSTAGVIHEHAQFSSINPTQQLPSSSPNTSTNVGLYY